MLRFSNQTLFSNLIKINNTSKRSLAILLSHQNGVNNNYLKIPRVTKQKKASNINLSTQIFRQDMSNFNSNEGIPEMAFPASALLPKNETGVLNFLQKYPQFDGRDVTIAIFDSGVDPRATGLQSLRDGKSVKVIERFDCTGCGDVEMTKKVTADANGYITGLTGRQLKLTTEMLAANTAKNEFRVGSKNIYDLSPQKAYENMINKLKLKTWDEPHKLAVADLARKINEFELQNTDASKLPWDKKLIKDDMDNIMELLNQYDKTFNDIKITYDCVMFPTTNGWHVVVDTTEKGDLENAVHIGEYTRTHEVKNLNDYMSVSVNVHDDGNVLELVGMCSPHGTHVASIASGNHESSDIDGVAPNAKIVSITIGDGRLRSMETGTGLVRGIMKVMEMCRSGRKIDVINMSYGEHAHWSNAGRIGELMSEVVNKYGVAWVVSAGNHGPALCTVGTPPDICQPCLIGVGAYVSPQMMEAEYAMREKLPGNCYTWTSRDPCIDGGQAVTVCAPGGAITSVPQFTMSKYQLMNGTSMAAPHVAGAVALLISGLKQKGIAYSPYSIKRALSATATKLGYVDPFAQGSGLLNVEKAFEHLVEYQKQPENMIRFSVRCGINGTKGIHIREGVLNKPYDYSVNIEPRFFNETETAAEDKFNFNMRLTLISSQPYVQVGSFLDMCYGSRSINVRIDPAGLQPGVHSAVIRAFDSTCVQKGSVFEIPVTIVQPEVINTEETRVFEPQSAKTNDGSIEFQQNHIQRHFVLVPRNATYAILRMRSIDKQREKDVGKFYLHTVQLLPKLSCRALELQKLITLKPENDSVTIFRCEQNNILELCIAKYWSNYGTSHLKYSLEFHGVLALNSNAYTMIPSRGIHDMVLTALGTEETQPQIQLKTATVVLKPSEAKISPLSGTRDVIPEGRQIYQNVLTYSFHVNKPAEVSLQMPLLSPVLYESEYESQFWMLFDCNKVMVASGDSNSGGSYKKLDKGEYTVKLQVRHEKRDLLEKLNEANMLACFKLANSLSLDFFDHYNQCLVSGRKFTSGYVRETKPRVVYVGSLTQEKLTKANLPSNCGWLSGSIVFVKDENARKIAYHHFTYILSVAETGKKNNGNGKDKEKERNSDKEKSEADAASSASDKAKQAINVDTKSLVGVPNAGGDGVMPAATAATANESSELDSPRKDGKSSVDDYTEALFDFQCSMISKMENEKSEKIYQETVTLRPKNLTAAHLALIQNIETNILKPQYPHTFVRSIKQAAGDGEGAGAGANVDEKGKSDIQKMQSALSRVLQLTDLVIQEIDKDALLAYLGLKTDTRPDAAKIKTNMEKQKSSLLEALTKQGIATAKLNLLQQSDTKECVEKLNDIYLEITKFADANDAKVLQFSLWHAYANRHYGRMYKYLQKLYEDKHPRECYEELTYIVDSLNYPYLGTAVQRKFISLYPKSYRLF